MSCREFASLFLDAWLAGELPAWRRRQCDSHVASCRACTEYAAGYRAVVVGVHGLATDPAEEAAPALDPELVLGMLGKLRQLDA